MNLEDIKKIVADCKKVHHDITMRDISYVILWREFKSPHIAYKSIYGDKDDKTIEKYDKSKAVSFLKLYMKSNFNKIDQIDEEDIVDYEKDITFEENKEAMLRKISVIEKKMLQGKIPDKDGEKIILDIRTKLNDKFSVSDKGEQKFIIVEQKYNAICPTCHHEICVPTKEELMKKYNLVEGKKK